MIVALPGLFSFFFYSTDRSKAVVPVLVLAYWFVLRSDLFYILPCVIFVLVFSNLYNIAIISLVEERANLSVFRSFVGFALVGFGRLYVSSSSWYLRRAAVCDSVSP